MGGSAECYSDLQDPRTGNATRHLLLEVPMIALCAMLCGAKGCVDMGAFVKANSLTSPAMFASLRRKTQTSLGRLRLVIHANGTTGSKSALGVRRGKAALFQWVQVPPGHRSSRKQPEQSWREVSSLRARRETADRHVLGHAPA